jgi:broad specificity phosphatase PhoE
MREERMADDAEIVLVRHGETEWTSSGKHTSYTDVALTERGREQAAALATRVRTREYALVLTSPRRRAIETCEFAGLHDHAEVTEDLAEWNYGEYEGLTTAEIRRRVPHWTIFNNAAPGGDSVHDVTARADRLLARAQAAGGPVALFSHGHFLRVLGARWLGWPAVDGRLLCLDVATLCVLGYEREERALRTWNA